MYGIIPTRDNFDIYGMNIQFLIQCLEKCSLINLNVNFYDVFKITLRVIRHENYN